MHGFLRTALAALVVTVVHLAAAPALAAAGVPTPSARCYQLVTDHGQQRTICIREDRLVSDVCRALRTYAAEWRLPAGFFARLIWQESRFNPQALSHAGAEGIAQFMPGTGRLRGLRNAFDPAEALARSAEYLRFLSDKFGNLGLAAAAYNSGEGRIERWTAAGGHLPAETRDYVMIITGREVEQWLTPAPVNFALRPDLPFHEACIELARNAPPARLAAEPTDWKPWGIMIAQDFSREVARRRFERVRASYPAVLGDEPLMMASGRNLSFGSGLRHFAIVGRDTRKEAEELCARLSAAGGTCVVRKN
jgi:hypothetical protein